MPKSLMDDIRTGAIELEGQEVDLQELEDAYDEDLDQEQYQDADNQEELMSQPNAQQQPIQPAPIAPAQ
jgi:hypothetical protein